MNADGNATETTCELLTLEQAAQYLGLAQGSRNPAECVRWLCRKREVRFCKIGKRIRFRRKWLDAYIEAQAVAPLRK